MGLALYVLGFFSSFMAFVGYACAKVGAESEREYYSR